jgi:transposase InsO family protein
MIFGQLSYRESLRDLIIVIEAHQSKVYHLGFGKNVSRSNLSNANENRNFKIFEEFASHLISIAQKVKKELTKKLKQNSSTKFGHADITVFKALNNVKHYIYTVMDNYSRYILNW